MADKKKILIAESTLQGLDYKKRLPDYDIELIQSGEMLGYRLQRGVDGLDMLVLDSNMSNGPRGSQIAREYRITHPNLPVVVTTISPEKYEPLGKIVPVYRPLEDRLIDYIKRTLG